MLTEEQKEAQKLLSQLGSTGSINGLTLGKPYEGSLGDFSLTDIEGLAGGNIEGNIGSTPQSVTDATGALTRITNQGFDPNSPVFKTFEKALARSTRDQADVLGREAAITGDRYSTSIGKEKGLLAERQSDIAAEKLAQLFNQAQDRSLQASGALGSLGLNQAANERANNQLALLFGGIQRDLKNQEAKAKLNEFNRQRSEKLGRIDVLSNVFNKQVPFGVKSIESQSPFSQLLNSTLAAAGEGIVTRFTGNPSTVKDKEPIPEE